MARSLGSYPILRRIASIFDTVGIRRTSTADAKTTGLSGAEIGICETPGPDSRRNYPILGRWSPILARGGLPGSPGIRGVFLWRIRRRRHQPGSDANSIIIGGVDRW